MWGIIIALIGGIGIGVGITLFLKKGNNQKENEQLTQSIENKLNEMLPNVINQANVNLVAMANEKLTAETKQNKADLENKRDEITRIVKDLEQHIKDSDKDRVHSYSELATSLKENREATEKLSVSTSDLKKMLDDNQIRGQFGEKVADDLLKMSGFVEGVDYDYNKKQSDSQTRPDFTVFLPDKTKINIDSKFPYSNLRNMTETDDKAEKTKYLKLFKIDVENKIKQVTERDYINPADNTVDFVILFIPNEMIFSYIYDKLPEITEEAMNKKVILAGPFSFTAILRMIRQAYENFRMQKNINSIITDIQAFEKEYHKFADEFVKFGDRIDSLQKQYNTVTTTRFNQLERRIDKVENSASTGEQTLLDLPNP